jgi:hypothetical protein
MVYIHYNLILILKKCIIEKLIGERMEINNFQMETKGLMESGYGGFRERGIEV